MYNSVKGFSILKRISGDGIILNRKNVRRLESIRTYTELKSDHNGKSFGDVLKFRREQCKRTILIHINASECCKELLDYVNAIGKVKTMYHYQTRKPLHQALVEMEDEESFNDVLDHTQLNQNQLKSTYTNFLTFKPSKKYEKLNGTNELIAFDTPICINSKYYQFNFINDVKSIRTVMFEMYENSKISDLGFRLRFLTAHQLESSMKLINPLISVLPFGSSITGFGNLASDIDMVATIIKQDESKQSELQFLVKDMESGRALVENHIDVLQEAVKALPGCFKVKPIPKARVPIVKYYHNFTSLNCDISLYSTESLMISELLYFLSSLDDRIKFLVFLVRRWASVHKLTARRWGEKVSNFCLTLLTLHFLQRVNPPLIPPWSELNEGRTQFLSSEKYAELFNKYSANCRNNQQTVEELLLDLFRFYSEFNFAKFGINLKTGEEIEKESWRCRSLLIENPVQEEMIIGGSVTAKEVTRLRNCMKTSFRDLDKALKSEGIPQPMEIPGEVSEDPRIIRSRVSNFKCMN